MQDDRSGFISLPAKDWFIKKQNKTNSELSKSLGILECWSLDSRSITFVVIVIFSFVSIAIVSFYSDCWEIATEMFTVITKSPMSILISLLTLRPLSLSSMHYFHYFPHTLCLWTLCRVKSFSRKLAPNFPSARWGDLCLWEILGIYLLLKKQHDFLLVC